jgi:hypothetical protein
VTHQATPLAAVRHRLKTTGATRLAPHLARVEERHEGILQRMINAEKESENRYQAA